MSEQTKSAYLDAVSIDDSLDQLPDEETLAEAVSNLEAHGFVVEVVEDDEAALEFLKGHIPAGASVMNGHSTTLEEIGFMEYLSAGDHEWEALPDEIWSIDDDAEREAARRQSQTADYFLGSVNAVAATGELVAADASGSRIGAYPFAAEHVTIVSGVNKIVSDLSAALDRVENVAFPLENERAQEAYGMESSIAKHLIYRYEWTEDRTTVVLIEDHLGY